jgi:predicted alpha-1,2-mannosidase
MRHLRIIVITLLLATPAHALGPWTVPPRQPGALGREVDPRMGTGGLPWASGSVSPAAQVPFGMVQLGPDTAPLFGRGLGGMRTSGYWHGDLQLWGFSHSRLSGTGAGEGGLFRITPRTSRVSDRDRRSGRKALFLHRGEAAAPGEYAVALPFDRALVELTASAHVGAHRYTFEPSTDPVLLLDASSHLSPRGRTRDVEVRIDPTSGEVEGSCRLFDDFSGRQGGVRAHFVARFDPPFTTWGAWRGGALAPGSLHALGEAVGAQLGWARSAQRRVVTVCLALSYVSVGNARLNLNAEAPAGTTFDALRARATQAWEDALARARVAGGSRGERTIFATSLYRSLLMPTQWSDVNGEYPGFDGTTHVALGFTYLTNMSLWDTFRTQCPLLTLVAPERQRDAVVSLVEMAAQGGGYLPRWPCASACSGSMLGSPADIVISEAWQKGVRGFDVNAAYAAMTRAANASAPAGLPSRGRADVEEYVRHGWCPADRMEEAVSRTLEYAWADAAIARLADGLGRAADAALYRRRAGFHANTWNPATRHFQPRNADGSFATPFVPWLLTYLDVTPGKRLTNDYVEGCANHWRYAPLFDVQGLAALFGGRDALARDLDAFFARSSPARGAFYPGSDYWHGNEHDIHAAYVFALAGRPDLTQRWARWVLSTKYGTGPGGLDGQDDGGTLSAWYVLSAIGLYPVAGTDTYVIGSPLFDRADVDLGGRALTVIADAQSPTNMFIQSATLNGAPHLVPWVTHAQLAGGATLRLVLGPSPSAWGR